jgi:DNA mismatch repair ATPase MutL
MLKRIENIFSKNFTDRLLEVCIENDYIKLTGFVSKDIQSGSKYNKSKAVYFYFINGRSMKKIKKIDDVILNIYKQYNKESNPIRIINLAIPEGEYDININENKDDVILMREKDILTFIDSKFREFHEERIKMYSANLPPSNTQDNRIYSQVINTQLDRKRTYSESHQDEVEETFPKKPRYDTYVTPLNKVNIQPSSDRVTVTNPKLKNITKWNIKVESLEQFKPVEPKLETCENNIISQTTDNDSKRLETEIPIEYEDIFDYNLNECDNTVCKNVYSFEETNDITTEVDCGNNIKKQLKVFDKNDFTKMKIIGQFNKGFIITKKKKE